MIGIFAYLSSTYQGRGEAPIASEEITASNLLVYAGSNPKYSTTALKYN